jgi:hypothetical protein
VQIDAGRLLDELVDRIAALSRRVHGANVAEQ